MSGSMNRNPSSQPPSDNKDERKDVFNLTVGGQKVPTQLSKILEKLIVEFWRGLGRQPYTQQSFGTFTPQNEQDFTEVLSKRNVRKQQKQQQQQQTPKQHTMTTRSSSTGPQVVIEQRSYDKSAYQQAASNETSMDINNNNKNDNQQSTRQSSKDKQASNPPQKI
ncbi:unnamed protein product [Rhizophagus irregularis]|nr:unnamed protein product [Rhizophagus irregularis]